MIYTQEMLVEPTGNSEKSEPQMGFEPTTLRDLVGCSNHSATGDSMASKGEMWVFDSRCITQLHSQMTDSKLITASRSHLKARIFPSSQWVLPTLHFSFVYIIITFAHLGGWLAASQICFKVTARCSYELCCQSFDSVAA